eukprot:COSAG01_NODE_35412_length_532_cov_0.926097_2_plen_123_part_01
MNDLPEIARNRPNLLSGDSDDSDAQRRCGRATVDDDELCVLSRGPAAAAAGGRRPRLDLCGGDTLISDAPGSISVEGTRGLLVTAVRSCPFSTACLLLASEARAGADRARPTWHCFRIRWFMW